MDKDELLYIFFLLGENPEITFSWKRLIKEFKFSTQAMTKDSEFFTINASIDLLPTLSLDKSKLFLVELMTFMPSLDVYNGEKSWLFFIKLHAPDNWVSPEVD